jgi:hypothetical protein
MSLPGSERRKLRGIERAAAKADPGLAARFSIFNQLSRQEDMPRTERLRGRRGIRRMRWAERGFSGYLISGTDTLLQGRDSPLERSRDVPQRQVRLGVATG